MQAKGRSPAPIDMDAAMNDPFGYYSLVDWHEDLPPPLDAAGGEDGIHTMVGRPQIAAIGPAQPLGEAIPGYSANNAANGGTTQATTTPIPSQAGVETPGLDQGSIGTDNGKTCACIVCLRIGTRDPVNGGLYFHCRFGNCNWVTPVDIYYPPNSTSLRSEHERSHYQRGPAFLRTPFSCLVENCHYTSKRWVDLQRHTTAKHCNNPAKFACSVIGCKYYGEGNGFTRSDKLKAHHKSMHQGQRIHGKAARTIKAAPTSSSHAEASGSSSMSA